MTTTDQSKTTSAPSSPSAWPRCRVSKQHPKYVDLLPPCNNACPAGENIQSWLGFAQAGRFQQAWETIIENNPMPAIHGRVCYHPCESNCNRKNFDSTVSIHAIERFLGDSAIKENWPMPKSTVSASGKKVLVVGAGPAGLSAAYHLRRLGHGVTICEAAPSLGGMMSIGIPDYRLPKETLQGEAQRIISTGIELKLKTKVEDILAEKAAGNFDAVFLAVGAHKGKLTAIEAKNNPCPVWDAIHFLRAVKTNTLPKIGENLLVFGGSNTAMDVARTARRLGIKNVVVAYHRSRQRMAAFDFEIEEALEEGVQLKVLRSLVEVDGHAVKLNVVELDASGSPQPTGEVDVVAADMVVFALGQTPETEFLKKVPGIEFKSNGSVLVNDQMMTGCNGIFAGGDMLPYDQSVTIATGHGKKAARHIDAYLRGTTYIKPQKHALASYDKLQNKMWFQEKTPKTEQTLLNADTRVQSFAEVVSGLEQPQAHYEAKRCLSCGNCFECDSCYGVCPVKAITKLGRGKRYKFEQDKCIGCAQCFKICPCAAIEMEKE